MTKNTEQAVNIFAEKIAQTFEKRLNELSEGIDSYQTQLLASLKDMDSSGADTTVMERISKSQTQLTKEIRSLYKENEEIFSKIKSSDGLIKFPNSEKIFMQDSDNQKTQSNTDETST